MDGQHRWTNRRRLLGTVAAAVPGFALGGVARAGAVGLPPDRADAAAARRAAGPEWSVTVYAIQDPYAGTIQVPTTAPPGTRYIAAEVAIDNASNQPLDFTPVEIRVRSAGGVEFRGGGAVGTEPAINPRNLNGGERSRGWVWFTVAADAKLVELVYVGPPPQFRIPLLT